MSLVGLLAALVVIGVLLYLFNSLVTGIDPNIKTIINAVVIIVVVLWLADVFLGFGPNIGHWNGFNRRP